MKDFKDNERVKAVAVIFIVSLGVYLFFRFILPLILPFFWAGVLTVILNPLICWLYKKTKISKGILTAIIIVALGGGIGYLLYLLIIKLFEQLHYLIQNYPIFMNQLSYMLKNCCSAIEKSIGFDASLIENFIIGNLENAISNLSNTILPQIMDNSLKYMTYIITIFGAFIVFIIAVLMFEKDYDKIIKFSNKYSFFHAVKEILHRIISAGLLYIKAQLIIMFIIGAICVVGLMLAGNPYAFLIGSIIGLLDSLPLFGTGSILIPWALIMLVQGNIKFAAIYLTIYIITSFARELLEPKLIGKKLGIAPIAVLIAIYSGIELFGLKGVIYGPMAFLCAYEILYYFFTDEPEETEQSEEQKSKDTT